ncbi:Retrovirus-related Pol polyprotein from transposon RE1 [Linum grandiflorum]
MGHVDGSSPAPPQQLNSAPNPAYTLWYSRDQLVLSWIILSLSEAMLPNIINKHTALDAWSSLARIYASGSKIQIHQLRASLNQLNRVLLNYYSSLYIS